MILYTYFRSSAAYRVRIALQLKGIQYESRHVHLLRGGGEQHGEDYRRLNPLGRVPTLIDGDLTLTQSGAIMEYLEERFPAPAILPKGAAERALARSIALTIVADTQPLQNVGVARYLSRTMQQSREAIDDWTRHFMNQGLAAVEKLLDGQARPRSGPSRPFCVGDHPTVADICLVAQCFASRRLDVPVSKYPNVARIDAACRELAAFQAAAPESQADFEA